MSAHHRTISFVLLAAFLGGAVPVFAKISLSEIPPLSFTFFRFVLATLILLPLYLRVRQRIGSDLPKVACISLFAVGNVVLFSFGIQRTGAGIAQALYTLSPLLTVIFSVLLLRLEFSRRTLFGVVVGFAGALLITALPLIGRGTSSATLLGNGIIILAVISMTLHTMYSKPLQHKYHPIEITTFFSSMAVALFIYPGIF